MPLFETTLLSFCKTHSKLDLPTLRQGRRERKNATEQIKNMKLAKDIFYILSYFLFVPLRSFFLCYSFESLGGPISTGVCINLSMLIQITTYRYEELLY